MQTRERNKGGVKVEHEDIKKILNQQLELLIEYSNREITIDELVDLNEQILRNLNFLSNLIS